MSYYLFWPDAIEMRREGFASVGHVPAVFDSNWCYEPVASRYLREKARLELPHQTRKSRYLTPKTLETYGQSLCNFLEWCAARSVSWTSIAYTDHVINGFQADMFRGEWSSRNRPLAARTVNLRVSVVTEFLKWAAARNLRDSFQVPAELKKVRAPTHRNSQGQKTIAVLARAGSVRPDPSLLRIPTDAEIESWRAEVAAVAGPTKLLMVDLVLATGIRREEVAQWQIDTLPLDASTWQIRGGYVSVLLTHGTKGGKHPGPDGVQIGPSRHIDIPIKLAERLAKYREFVRPGQARQYVTAATETGARRKRMAELRSRLFLSDFSGVPVASQSLYESWTRCKRRPFPGWSVHAGRHYYACKTLLNRVSQSWSGGNLGQGLVTTAQDVISLVIQPQLGHVDVGTTQKYLTWIERMFVGTDLHEAYAASLESITGAEDGTV